MKKSLAILFVSWMMLINVAAQVPWENALWIATSSDGTTFNTPSVFQDSSGVPSVVHWKGDTVVAVFQWFPAPVGGPSWDSIAVKFSFDLGQNWTNPIPVEMPDLPAGYQRPFDPTLAVLPDGRLRVYFSSSNTPSMGLDSTINTYSAISSDGINFSFESGARFDHPTTYLIDPAIIRFKNIWHYTSPYNTPTFGAHHATGPDGLTFTAAPDIISDPSHNWLGNFCYVNSNELRFYGCAANIWYNTSANGGLWNGYVNTNLVGGDPAATRLPDSSYLLIYVGPAAATIENQSSISSQRIWPNPFNDYFFIQGADQNTPVYLFDASQRIVNFSVQSDHQDILNVQCPALKPGHYRIEYLSGGRRYSRMITKK